MADTKPLLSNKMYDILKYLSLYVLPALGALYFSVAQIWGLPKAEEVVGTVVAIETFLGIILKISTTQYNKSDAKYDGVVELEQGDDGQTHLFVRQFDGRSHVLDLSERKELLFKVEA